MSDSATIIRDGDDVHRLPIPRRDWMLINGPGFGEGPIFVAAFGIFENFTVARGIPKGSLVHRDGSRKVAGSEGSTLYQARTAYERDYILKKLDENHGNVSRTAEVLGMERSHLYRKMKSLGLAAKE